MPYPARNPVSGSTVLADAQAVDTYLSTTLPGDIAANGPVTSVASKTGAVTLAKADVGLANVDNTADTAKPVSTAQAAALAGKESSVAAGTTAQYYRGDKTFQALDKSAVGLTNVDNTSDASKPISTAAVTALAGKAAVAHTHAASDVTSGVLPPARLGTGTADATTILYGDGTYKTAPSGGGGAVSSVNTKTGAVVINPDDLTDAATANKFTTATERAKLAGIATGATVNSTDAVLKARANHTGTQLAATVSNFTTATQAVPLPGTTAAGAGAADSYVEKFFTDGLRGPQIYLPSAQWAALNQGVADARYFGVKADGTTDDTAALQAAIEFLAGISVPGLNFQNSSGTFQAGSAAPGAGTLILPYGTMQITTLTAKHRLTIEGQGDGTLLCQIAGTTGHMIQNQRDATAHASYVRIRNFQMDGNKANQTAANYGIYLLGDTTNTYNSTLDEDYDIRCRVENVYVRNCKGDGIVLDGSGGNFLSNIQVRNCDGNGIYAYQDNNLVNIDVGWSGLRGIVLAGDSSRLTNAKAWYSGQVTAGSGQGFYVTADEFIMTACTAQDNAAQGYLFDGAYNGVAAGLSAQQNSKSSSGVYAGFDFYNSKYVLVQGTVSNRYNAGSPLQTTAVKHAGGSDYNDIQMVAGRSADLWQTSTALSSDSVKNSSRIYVNGVSVAPGASV